MAERFLYQAFEADGLPSVLWVVQLDPRGASSIVHRCKQAHPPAPTRAHALPGVVVGGSLSRLAAATGPGGPSPGGSRRQRRPARAPPRPSPV